MKLNEEYWRRVRARAKALGSDGCTKALDIYLDCCYEHDVHLITGMTMYDMPISIEESNDVFRH